MAKKSKSDDLGLVYIVGAIILLPIIFISLFYYLFLKIRYLKGDAIRVVDIKGCVPFALKSVSTIVITFWGIAVMRDNPDFGHFIGLIGVVFIFVLTIAIAMRLAVKYLCFVVSLEKNHVVIPADMQSYTISDYITLRFIFDLMTPSVFSLSSIDSASRGRGTELYLHGDFGSRGAYFSSKQKRDEALFLIKRKNKNTGTIMDLEGY